MDYFKVINLKKEPFSNSPDPDFFFKSNTHVDCLQKVELSIRLKKGLAVIIGDVGTGKTTLCRQMIRNFADDEQIETHLILDPGFRDPSEFLQNLAKIFRKRKPARGTSDLQIKESIKKYLFKRGVDEGKTVLLIIDEGQKLSGQSLEILRELLNFETNEYKLLQIVIFAQKELEPILHEHKNFIDRVNLYYILKPFNFKETISLIRFRLECAGDPNKGYKFLTYPAMIALYISTGGYPRKIVNLCHRILLTLIIQNRSTAGWSAIRSNVRRTFYNRNRGVRNGFILALFIICVLSGIFYFKSFLKSNKSDYPGNYSKPDNVISTSLNESELIKVEDKQDGSLKAKEKMGKATSSRLEKSPGVMVSAGERNLKPDDPEDEIVPLLTQPDTINPPNILGELAIEENDTIGKILKLIYGSFTPEKLQRTLEYNHDLVDPDILSIGQMIRFPFIHIKENTIVDYYWVEITRMNNLEDAYGFLKNYPYDDPYVIMVPFWDEKKGLRFSIVLENYFSEKKDAEEELNKLPPELLEKANILYEWTEGTIFCSNAVFNN